MRQTWRAPGVVAFTLGALFAGIAPAATDAGGGTELPRTTTGDAESEETDNDPQPRAKPAEQLLVVGARLKNQDPVAVYMDAETLAGIPGVNDDPLSALATLPGVAVNNDFEGGAAVRGGRPVDNAYRVDFLDIGYLFHFGTGSVVDGDLVEGFAFHAAGYGARYQNAIGAVVDAETRDPAAHGAEAMVDVNFLHGGILVEGPLNDDQRGYLSMRGSYYDLLMAPFLDQINDSESDDVDVVQLPRFWDYRGRYQIDLGQHSHVDILVDGAMDEAELLYHEESTETLQDPALAGGHRFALDYSRQGIVLSHDSGSTDRWRAQIGLSRVDSGFSARLGGAGDVNTTVVEDAVRLEVNAPQSGSHRLGWGVTAAQANVRYDVLLRDAGCTEFEVDCRFSDADPIEAEDRLPMRRLNAYVEDRWAPSESLTFTLGVAYGEDDYLDESAIEPRASVVWSPHPRSTLTLAAGDHHQLPAFEYIERQLGNPDLDYLEAKHYVLSFRHRFLTGWLVRAETYLRKSRNLVTANDATRYDNRGMGTARGAELLVQGHFGPRLVGWMALSYAESLRHDPDTGRTFHFAYDQPLIASIVAKFALREDLSLSGKAWFHSGPPHTPILGSKPDPMNPGGHLPVYGELNGERLPSYFRLDLRADWTLGKRGDLSVYAEVLNATSHRNVSGYEYAEDYLSRQAITQIPWFVSLGVRKRW